MVIVPLLNYPGQKPEEPEEEVGSSFKLFFILIHIFTMHTGTGAVLVLFLSLFFFSMGTCSMYYSYACFSI